MKNLRLLLVLITLFALVGRPDRASAAPSTITLTTLYSFVGGADGVQPSGALIIGSDSNFYGTTFAGGLLDSGTVFQVTPNGALTTLHNFTGSLLDGGLPQAGLVQGLDGNFYGTTSTGGLSSSGAGTVYSITSNGTFTTLYRFSGGSDGGEPRAALIQGSDSNFYGTTFAGGTSGVGVVFKMTPAGTLTPLWQFSGSPDGANPMAGLVLGTNGNFYGTTYNGGAFNQGSIFSITSTGGLIVTYNFSGGDGANPAGSLVLANNRFYGTTFVGGNGGGLGGGGTGSVFSARATGAGVTALYDFNGGGDGGFPQAGLIIGSDGNFYGTTSALGGGGGGGGTVFKITPSGALTTLYRFNGLDGAVPLASLVQANVSNFFGTTSAGGTDNVGTVFSLIQPCTYTISATKITLPATSNTGTFTVTAGITNCPWTAISSADWITITSTNSGFGSGTISYLVAANTNATTRVGTITVEGKVFTINQQAQVLGRFLLGTYSGLAIQSSSPSQSSSGSLSLSLGKTGSFNAKMTMGGVRSSFKGLFDASGNSTNTVARKGLSSLTVILQILDVSNETDQIVGTISDGVSTSDVLANLAVFSSVNPSPWVGYYTFILEPADDTDPTVPQGYGSGTLKVSTTGTGQMRGVLGDGTKISGTIAVSAFGTWPLYASLYKNQGCCIAWVTLATNNTLSATANWFKPAVTTGGVYPGGFTTVPTLTGALYVSSKDGGPSLPLVGQLTLGGGNLTTNLVKSLTIGANGSVTVSPVDVDKLTLKINPTTGQFTGSFLNPASGKSSKLNGLLLQDDNSGAGFFPGTNQTGFFTFEPGL